MKKVLHFIWSLLEIIIIVYVILMTSILLSKNKYGYTQFGNYTLCTIDLINERGIEGVEAGDLLIVKNSNKINKGDIIYYYIVYNETYVVQSAPVISVESDKYSSVYTIDDNGPLTIASSRVLGKDKTIYHNIGSALNVIESKLGFLFLVLLPILVIFVYQIYELVMIFRYEQVEEKEAKFQFVDSEKENSEKSV